MHTHSTDRNLVGVLQTSIQPSLSLKPRSPAPKLLTWDFEFGVSGCIYVGSLKGFDGLFLGDLWRAWSVAIYPRGSKLTCMCLGRAAAAQPSIHETVCAIHGTSACLPCAPRERMRGRLPGVESETFSNSPHSSPRFAWPQCGHLLEAARTLRLPSCQWLQAPMQYSAPLSASGKGLKCFLTCRNVFFRSDPCTSACKETRTPWNNYWKSCFLLDVRKIVARRT